MKKIIGCAAIMFCLAGASASAWDASYLLTYPKPIEKGNWLLDLGIGFGLGGSNTLIPPILFTAEYALPIADLPFTIGGLVGFAWSHWESGDKSNKKNYWERDWIHIPVGFRIAYHFNWGVDKLDTYVTTTLGWDIAIYTGTYYDGSGNKHDYDDEYNGVDYFLFGTHIGARYYFIPNVGAFLELGGYAPHYAALGVAFRF